MKFDTFIPILEYPGCQTGAAYFKPFETLQNEISVDVGFLHHVKNRL